MPNRSIVCWCLFAAFVVFAGWESPAGANDPLGACCFGDSSCQDLAALNCAAQGGQFIGDATSCATTQCRARVEAPVLSILGLVGVVGALGGLGVYRILRKRS